MALTNRKEFKLKNKKQTKQKTKLTMQRQNKQTKILYLVFSALFSQDDFILAMLRLLPNNPPNQPHLLLLYVIGLKTLSPPMYILYNGLFTG